MPRIRLTKSAIDALPTSQSDVVYWDAGWPGFGVKVTPKGRKVFVVLYRTGGAGSKLRKYTIGPYGRVTLHQARLAAQKVFSARSTSRPGNEYGVKTPEPVSSLRKDSSERRVRPSLTMGESLPTSADRKPALSPSTGKPESCSGRPRAMKPVTLRVLSP